MIDIYSLFLDLFYPLRITFINHLQLVYKLYKTSQNKMLHPFTIYLYTRNKNSLRGNHNNEKKLFRYFNLACFQFSIGTIFIYSSFSVRIVPSVILLGKDHQFLYVYEFSVCLAVTSRHKSIVPL